MRKVVITVRGGVAEVAECPDDVEVEIIDYDNLEAEQQDALFAALDRARERYAACAQAGVAGALVYPYIDPVDGVVVEGLAPGVLGSVPEQFRQLLAEEKD